MGGDGLAFELRHDVVEAVGTAVDIRVVDLVGIAGEDDLGPLPHAGDDGFDFERGQILGLVDDHELVRDGAAADVAESFDDDGAAADEVSAAAAFVAHVEVAEHFEGVVDGLHPGGEFFFEAAGKEAEFFAHGDGGARDNKAAVFAIDDGAFEAGGHGHQSFARARFAHEGDEFYFFVEERVEGEALFAVAGFDAPDAFAEFEDGNEFCAGRIDFSERRFLGVTAVGEEAIFVGAVTAWGKFDFAVDAEFGELLGRDRFFEHAGVEVGDEYAIGFVILSLQTEGVGFDAEVDVFGDEDGGCVLIFFVNAVSEREDAAVDGVVADGDGAVGTFFGKNDSQIASVGERDAFAESAFGAKFVEATRNGARVLTEFAGLAFEAIDFFDDIDRNKNGVLLEIEDGVGVVEENVGVEDVIFHCNFTRVRGGGRPPGRFFRRAGLGHCAPCLIDVIRWNQARN